MSNFEKLEAMMTDTEAALRLKNKAEAAGITSPRLHLIAGESGWRLSIPHTDDRRSDLLVFLTKAADAGISKSDVREAAGKAFADLTLGEIDTAIWEFNQT
ncbi:hypothetical protein IFT66_06875 [Rhizobium sp. CFBP 13726]|uniref:hypothetical protein n=1 Tax=Rhizobium sp. CFBP 13726 TaxID=2775296 RepID=UPI0017817431|nr:hypothetical protein [Rhizobium sp. CFBP 13726]MBD8650799.1 hypothetical protein [Rhizobium sp. CFBP 13726]